LFRRLRVQADAVHIVKPCESASVLLCIHFVCSI
jgi:hypothetical protein